MRKCSFLHHSKKNGEKNFHLNRVQKMSFFFIINGLYANDGTWKWCIMFYDLTLFSLIFVFLVRFISQFVSSLVDWTFYICRIIKKNRKYIVREKCLQNIVWHVDPVVDNLSGKTTTIVVNFVSFWWHSSINSTLIACHVVVSTLSTFSVPFLLFLIQLFNKSVDFERC